jgi:hypothetical protein
MYTASKGGTSMKLIVIFTAMFFAASAHADQYTCRLNGLSQGQLIREFLVQAPDHARILTTLPDGSRQVTVWTYEGSMGVEIENLLDHSTELSTQMTFENNGIFDLTFKSADVRLTCTNGL